MIWLWTRNFDTILSSTTQLSNMTKAAEVVAEIVLNGLKKKID